jgi:hypothetical protein
MYGSITRTVPGSADPTSNHSTTINAPFAQSCYLCWRHAEHTYSTTPCFLAGVYYPSELRHLCRIHWRQVWQVLLESLYNRVQMQDERGQVA